MSWDELLGQETAARYLRRALCGGRFAHGCLLEGPQGVGKRTAASILARVLLCHRPTAPERACGECKSCHWLRDWRGGLTRPPDLLIPWKKPTDKSDARPLRDEEALVRLEAAGDVLVAFFFFMSTLFKMIVTNERGVTSGFPIFGCLHQKRWVAFGTDP